MPSPNTDADQHKRPRAGPPSPLLRARQLLRAPRPDLRWHHEFGQALAGLRRGRGGRPRSVLSLADQLGLSRARVQQHLDFANQVALADLAGLPLPWAAVVDLLGVKDPDLRSELTRAAIAGGWSAARVRREVRQARPDRGPPIRRRRVAADLTELGRLADALEGVLGWWQEWEAVLPPAARRRLLEDLGRGFADWDSPERKRLAALGRLIGWVLERLEGLRSEALPLLGPGESPEPGREAGGT